MQGGEKLAELLLGLHCCLELDFRLQRMGKINLTNMHHAYAGMNLQYCKDKIWNKHMIRALPVDPIEEKI